MQNATVKNEEVLKNSTSTIMPELPKFHPNSLDSMDLMIDPKTDKPLGCLNMANPKCKLGSEYCTEVMSKVHNLCKWHHARMASWQEIECGCRKHIAYNSDSGGRIMFRRYYEVYDLPVVITGGSIYCCYKCGNADTDIYMCGTMHVCEEGKHLHDPKTLKAKSEVKSEPVEDGAVKVLIKGILGIKVGAGFYVAVILDRGNVVIKTYEDAMETHVYFSKRKDDRSFLWLVVASHMKDRPTYIQPIMHEDLVYP
jgi:hypothetical protein